MIKPIKITDRVIGAVLEIRESPYYTVISINKRCFYFIKETGEFDGTSMPMH